MTTEHAIAILASILMRRASSGAEMDQLRHIERHMSRDREPSLTIEEPALLSVEDRLLMYEWALVIFDDVYKDASTDFGLCRLMFRFNQEDSTSEKTILQYPELVAQKPTGRGMREYWWGSGNTKKRKLALRRAIRSCRTQMLAS